MKGLQARIERLEIDVTHNEIKISDVDTLAVDHAGELDVMAAVLYALIETHHDRAALETAFQAALSRAQAFHASPPLAGEPEMQPVPDASFLQARAVHAATWQRVIGGSRRESG